jgi:hypothetical protein
VHAPLWTYREEPPAAFDAAQFVFAALVELEPRADNEIADGARDQDLSGVCEGTDAGLFLVGSERGLCTRTPRI